MIDKKKKKKKPSRALYIDHDLKEGRLEVVNHCARLPHAMREDGSTRRGDDGGGLRSLARQEISCDR